jgi:hypothetical protein
MFILKRDLKMNYFFKFILASLLLSNLAFAQTDFGLLEEPRGKEFYTDMALFREKDRDWRLTLRYSTISSVFSNKRTNIAPPTKCI